MRTSRSGLDGNGLKKTLVHRLTAPVQHVGLLEPRLDSSHLLCQLLQRNFFPLLLILAVHKNDGRPKLQVRGREISKFLNHPINGFHMLFQPLLALFLNMGRALSGFDLVAVALGLNDGSFLDGPENARIAEVIQNIGIEWPIDIQAKIVTKWNLLQDLKEIRKLHDGG